MLCLTELVGFGVRQVPFIGAFDGLAAAPISHWGTRRLYTAYAGPILRVLRDSDDAETDIGYDAAGDLDAAAATAFAGGSTLYVPKAYDQSGVGNHPTQSVKANMPSLNLTGLNGKPCLVFDGSNDYLLATLAASITGTGMMSAVLAQRTADVANAGLAPIWRSTNASDWNTNDSATLEDTSGTIRCTRNFATSDAASTVATATPYVPSIRFDGTGAKIGLNGTETTGSANANSFNADRWIIGTRRSAGAYTAYYNGRMAEGVLCGANPASGDQALFFAAMKARGGIA